jgi:hypothetical protein
MASRQQIARLGQRIEALANQRSDAWPRGPVLVVRIGETHEAAWARRLSAHPEDLGKSPAFIVQIVNHETATNSTWQSNLRSAASHGA